MLTSACVYSPVKKGTAPAASALGTAPVEFNLDGDEAANANVSRLLSLNFIAPRVKRHFRRVFGDGRHQIVPGCDAGPKTRSRSASYPHKFLPFFPAPLSLALSTHWPLTRPPPPHISLGSYPNSLCRPIPPSRPVVRCVSGRLCVILLHPR